MSRLTKAFANKARIAYLTAGDGGDISAEYFIELAHAGANILEVGIPFSDPVADGEVIQLAMDRALKNNTDIKKVLEIIKKIRLKTDAAIVVFTYFNPIVLDLKQFLTSIKSAGADGILVVDVPFEESQELIDLCKPLELAPIMVAAPSTPLERVRLLSEHGGGFLYYACRKGTTGVKDSLPQDIIDQIKQVKNASCLPVAVGFGVSNNMMVNQILTVADGCVIGSYFVDMIAHGKTPHELYEIACDVYRDAN